MSGSIESIQLLLQNGAKLDARDTNGRTPLDLAVAQGHSQETIQLLSPNDEDINHNNNVNDDDDFDDFLSNDMDRRILKDVSGFIQIHQELSSMAKYHVELTEELFGFACLMVFHAASNTNLLSGGNRQQHRISPTRTLRRLIDLIVQVDYQLLRRLEDLAMRYESSTTIRPCLWSVIQQEQVLIEYCKLLLSKSCQIIERSGGGFLSVVDLNRDSL